MEPLTDKTIGYSREASLDAKDFGALEHQISLLEEERRHLRVIVCDLLVRNTNLRLKNRPRLE